CDRRSALTAATGDPIFACRPANEMFVCRSISFWRRRAMTELLKPALYRAEGTDAVPAHPALLGGACACGYLFFPLQRYGCEKCGGLEIEPRALSGAGSLLASARVHLHAGKGREAPFTVGSVRLDDGPIVRTLIVESAGPLQA